MVSCLLYVALYPLQRITDQELRINLMKISEKQDWYLSLFQTFEKNLNGEETPLIHEVRKAAISRFAKVGFPTTCDEEWKYTDVSPIVKRNFKPVFEYVPQSLTTQEIKAFALEDLAGSRIVFVNGLYAAELSYLHPTPEGVHMGNLGSVIKKDFHLVEKYLVNRIHYEDNGFIALNMAFIQDGAFIYIPDGVIVEQPIHLLFISTDVWSSKPEVQSQDPELQTSDSGLLSQPWNLIITGRNSQVALVESYISLANDNYLTNAVTEISVGENSVVDYYKLQSESTRAFHIGTLYVHQDRQSNFSSNSLSFGGALVRNNVTVALDAEGAECTLNGLYLVTGRQHVDNHTVIDHIKPQCNSRELYKGVLDGRSRGVFNGKILVRKDAQKTNANQTNKNLLLSDNALIDTKPQLEIFANDVKCTHGATIGQLEEEALFYLRSRGVGLENARAILIYAFASEVINRIKLDPVRSYVDNILSSRLNPVTSGQ